MGALSTSKGALALIAHACLTMLAYLDLPTSILPSSQLIFHEQQLIAIMLPAMSSAAHQSILQLVISHLCEPERAEQDRGQPRCLEADDQMPCAV